MNDQSPDFHDRASEPQPVPRSSTNDRSFEHILAQMQPDADTAFRDNLEHHLLAQLQNEAISEANQKGTVMSDKPKNSQHPQLKPLRLALTAAVFALVLFGLAGFMMIFCQGGWCGNTIPSEYGAAGQVDEPVQLVIAAQTIPYGTQITDDMLTIITIEDASGIANDGFYDDVTQVIGQQAMRHIEILAPISTNFVSPPADCPENTEPCLIIPDGTVGIAFKPANDFAMALHTGTTVDVYALMRYVEVEGADSPEDLAGIDDPQTIIQRIVAGALFVDIQATDDGIITLAVAPQDAETLRFILDSAMPVWITPHATSSADYPVSPVVIGEGRMPVLPQE